MSKPKYLLFSALGLVTILLDQWTKALARTHLRPLRFGEKKVVVEGFFDLRYSENPGVAFGMFQDLQGGRVILTLVAAFALAMVVVYLRRADDRHYRLHAALGLIGGGAIGNLIDRIAYGRVTDFIVWRYQSFEWPAFNIADAALVVGVGLMILDMIRAPKRHVSEGASSDASA
ncbi:MAG: signal peptidase II [Myxococcales bacterium]|nr:signal peptidase II [Myxococcales bacterium]